MNNSLISAFCIALAFALPAAAGWDPNEVDELKPKAAEALKLFKEADSSVQRYIDEAAGYVVIPTVGKGGIGIGGARGKGLLYEGDKVTAVVTMTQLTIGLQLGGQAYSEFIFFKDDLALQNFKRGNYELGAQASAVAVTAGVSADAEFNEGVAIFTQDKGGLMYEATVSGQKFKVETAE
jgi:lipid-binding SYLF domain-containing protein